MVIVGLVELPETIQHLLDTAVLHTAERAPAEPRDCAARICQAARQLFGPRLTLGTPRHSLLTVLVRRGALELTSTDQSWLDGWQQAELRLPVFNGKLVLLTEQGWCSADGQRRGFHPVLAA